MNKQELLADTDVKLFVEWLAGNLPKLRICLRLKASRFVPKGIEADLKGIEAVLEKYLWKSSEMQEGNWAETKLYLNRLGGDLRKAVAANNQIATLDACKKILGWGGNRNWSTGAHPFLSRMATASPPSLCKYIRETGKAFELPTSNTLTIAPPVTKMNSMLTKVHALYATDGLPIYDSRVAAAIASLVECWRVDSGLAAGTLPHALVFPATLPTRTIFRLFPGATHHPGVMPYGITNTPADWSGSKIRLGWVMEAVLSKLPELFSAEGAISERMHAFEASLFVIGYDASCLRCVATAGEIDHHYKSRVGALLKPDKSTVPTETKTVRPLREQDDDKDIHYSGTLENGFNVSWGETQFKLAPGDIDEILSEFGGMSDIPLGASQTPPRPPASLGQWLEDNGWASARYASAIASILRQEGVIASHRGKSPIFLTFA